METWRSILGTDGCYEVSNFGMIRRAKAGPRTFVGRMLKPCRGKDGYLRVWILCFGKRRTLWIHQLVAFAFIGPCPDGMEVNHSDLDKTNNRVTNLEYVSRKQNIQHAMRIRGSWQPSADTHGRAKLSSTDASKIMELYSAGNVTQKALGRRFGVSDIEISRIVRRLVWL